LFAPENIPAYRYLRRNRLLVGCVLPVGVPGLPSVL
jgi:hypothetical protein